MALAFAIATEDPRFPQTIVRSKTNQTKVTDTATPVRTTLPSHPSEMPIATDVYALLPRASEKIARICAEMLTSAGHMTPSLAFVFLARGDRSSLIALSGAQSLPSTILLHRATTGTLDEARAVASRPHLDPLVLSGLIDRDDAVIDYLLAESRTLIDAYRVVDQLLFRAKKDQKLATRLFDRDDLSFHQRARLFEKASSAQRAVLMQEALNEEAASPHYEKSTIALPESLTKAIEHQERDDILSALAAGSGMSQNTTAQRSRLDHADGALAALACLAIGMVESEVRTLLRLIGTDPVLTLRPGGAEDVLERLTRGAAKILLDAINAPQQLKRDKTVRDRSLSPPAPAIILMDAVA